MNSKLKVLQILPELNAGGVERGTLELAQHLVKNEHESFVLSNGGRMLEQLEAEGSTHIKMPVHRKHLFSFFYVWQLRKLFLKERFDIIHIRSRMPAWLVYSAWKLIPLKKRPKLVSTVHGFYSVNLYSKIMTKGDAVICVSNSVKDYVCDHYSINKNTPLQVIHRGVDPNYFSYGYQAPPDWLEKWSQKTKQLKGKYLITLPGRFTAWKGHSDFLEILYYLKQDGIPVHALFVGEINARKKNYYYRLNSMINKLELGQDVSILEHRNDLREIMSVSDLVVSCSTEPEAFGRVSLEALSLGIPVIAYAHGGVREQLNTLFPYGKIEANKKSSMRLKIREYFQMEDKPKPIPNVRFTLDRMNNKVLNLYRSLTEKNM
ncbi:MAG: glycosyl transferase [Puniceicoccaceae bacterium]|nr:glycosyl transferase [Puniceicoccaceae bacterium]